MNTRQLCKELNLGPYTLSLFLQGKTPFVDFEGQSFSILWHLIEQLPLLSDPLHIKKFAYLSNFFWKAGDFQYIDSIPHYQEFYRQRIKEEKENPADLFEYRLTDYKIFDVSVMHDPKVENNQLTYFTYNSATGIPYRVVCPFPYHLHSTYVHYQILPVIDQ